MTKEHKVCMFRICIPSTQRTLFQTYLLHDFDRGKGTSRRSPDPHRSLRRWAGTGLCCPIWACRLPLLPPSSQAARDWGSGRPVPGSGTSTWTSYFSFLSRSAKCRNEFSQRLILWEKAAVCFYFCECVREGGCLGVFCGLSLSSSFSPTARP